MTILTYRLGGARSSLGYKAPCKVATTTNITLSGEQTIDGVAVTAEDRVLVKDQTNGAENGIYEVRTRTWVRAADWGQSRDITQGTRVGVVQGSTGAGVYQLATSGDIVLGTTSLSFVVSDSDAGDYPYPVTSRTILKALDTTLYQTAYLTEAGREGMFLFKTGDYSTDVTADTQEGVYIAADDTASTSGAWVRVIEDGQVTPQMFGAKGDNSTDDATSFQAAIDYLEAASGGKLYIPSARYRVNSSIVIDKNNVSLEGAGMTATIIDFNSTASSLQMYTNFNWVMEGFTVIGSTTDGIVVGESTGQQTYAAYFAMRDLATNNCGGRGISVGDAYMGSMTNCRAQNSGGIGIDMSTGFKTSIMVTNCHAFDSGSHGWKIVNGNYLSFHALGADRNTGYGYYCQDLYGTSIHAGAEDNDYSMFGFYYDAASSSLIKGFYGFKVGGYEKDNNATAGSYGTLATFTAAVTSATAGVVEFDSITQFDAPPSGNAIECTSGNYRIILPPDKSNITRSVGGGSFCVFSHGAGDASYGLPVNVSGANTPIAKLRPKMQNGVTSYGGLLTVYATANNLASGARSATYLVLVNRASAGTTSDIATISSVGNDAGSNSADASFTFSHDVTNDHLEVTVVGSTATGNWYFHITAQGNIDIEPL